MSDKIEWNDFAIELEVIGSHIDRAVIGRASDPSWMRTMPLPMAIRIDNARQAIAHLDRLRCWTEAWIEAQEESADVAKHAEQLRDKRLISLRKQFKKIEAIEW